MAVERPGGVLLGVHRIRMLIDGPPPGRPVPTHRIHGRTLPKLPLGMRIPERRIPMLPKMVDVPLVGMHPAGHQTLTQVGKAGKRRVGRLDRELRIQERLEEVDGAPQRWVAGGRRLMEVQTVIAHRKALTVDGEVL
jgi:hypothetical protein